MWGGRVSKGESGSHRRSLRDTVKGLCEDFGEEKKLIRTLKYYPILFVAFSFRLEYEFLRAGSQTNTLLEVAVETMEINYIENHELCD